MVTGFGREWSHFDQSPINAEELQAVFNEYFRIFPWPALPLNPAGFDLGCGSGRWAKLVAPRVGTLHCIDPSEAALEVAKTNLADHSNCRFHLAGADDIPLSDASADFGYSLGVLHHVPDTLEAIKACSRKLKRGAPFLLYLYFAFDNKPRWYRALWKVSEVLRVVLARSPFALRLIVSQVVAFLVYWPFARLARIAELLGIAVDSFPLSAYRNRSFYIMRTDALDRFGTKLEQRFTRQEITQMLESAGFEGITFSEERPYWCAVAFRK